MVSLDTLINYTNDLLTIDRFSDYCPNGLQVEGKAEIKRLVSGVTASQALIDAAIDVEADAVLVHHGYFWKGESAAVVGMKKRRLQALLANDISLIAYHLPLDAHPELGNNAQLAKLLGLQVEKGIDPDLDTSIGLVGHLSEPMNGASFAELISKSLGREPLHIPGPQEEVRRIAWCTGAAQSFIDRVAGMQVDAYLTGEVSEPTVHSAREQGIHFYAAGHHATERYGVKALGEHLAEKFDIECQFIDIDNPV